MPRKSDEPEYPVPPSLARLVSKWEKMCPGISQAVQEEIATGDWDRHEGGFVPPYEDVEALHVGFRVLEAQFLANHIRHQHRYGPWYVRWGMVKPSGVLPAPIVEFLSVAQEDVSAAIKDVEEARTKSLEQGSSAPQEIVHSMSWNSQPVSLTWSSNIYSINPAPDQ